MGVEGIRWLLSGRVEQALVPTKLRTVKQRVQSVSIIINTIIIIVIMLMILIIIIILMIRLACVPTTHVASQTLARFSLSG